MIRALARVADWRFVAALLLLAAAVTAAHWTAPLVAPPGAGRVKVDQEWLRAQAFRTNLELEAEAAREGRPLQKPVR
ncbi:MAG TPA: hypothetical protein VF702_10350 [Allosphingosinicella sp.]|jgi:hypothetical protein